MNEFTHMKRNTRTRLIDYTDFGHGTHYNGISFFEINDFDGWSETKGIQSVN